MAQNISSNPTILAIGNWGADVGTTFFELGYYINNQNASVTFKRFRGQGGSYEC